MRKILGILAILLIFGVQSAFGAWSAGSETSKKGDGIVTVTVTLTSDGSAGSYAIDTYLSRLKHALLYSIEITPGTGGVAPDNTFDLDIEDADAFHLIDSDANSNTAKSWVAGDFTLDQYPVIRGALSLVFADIGTSGDQVTITIIAVVAD